MAKSIFKNVFLSVNGVTLSDRVRTVTLEYGAEIQDSTAHGSNSRTRLAGLKDWSLSIEWLQDYAAANVDATLWPLVGAAAFAIILRPDAGVVGAANPQFTGNAVLESYQPMGGTVGDVHMSPSVLRGDGDLARAVA